MEMLFIDTLLERSRDDGKCVSRAQPSGRAKRGPEFDALQNRDPGFANHLLAPDQRRTTSLSLVLRRIRGTPCMD
jgi:hypothetical protein